MAQREKKNGEERSKFGSEFTATKNTVEMISAL